MSNNSSAGPSSEFSSESHQTKAKFRANFKSLDEIRDFVGQAAENCGFNPKAIYAVQLASDEAFTNIIEHAYGGESNEIIECTCQFDDRALTIILHDCGTAFDPTAIISPDLNAPLADRETGGLGIHFMRKLMDEVHFSPAPTNRDGCNTLTMIKRKEKPD